MKAINDYIIIESLKEEVKSGGLSLDSATLNNMRHRRGKILSVSELGVQQANLKEGDIVHYDKAQTFTILVDGTTKTIIRLRDIVLVE